MQFVQCASLFFMIFILLSISPLIQAKVLNLSDEQIVNNLNQYLSIVSKKEFSGVVLIAKDGKVIFKGAYGLASREYNVPNKMDTKFNLASIGKLFTSVAIAQLVEQRKLSLDDPVSKYLTDWLPVDIADKITIRQLLTHSSGLADFFENKNFQGGDNTRQYINVIDYKPLLKTEKLIFQPGTSQGYSNTGYLLLGAIIEKISGQNYFEYVKEHIFKPANMINSDFYEMDVPTPNLALGYFSDLVNGKTRWRNNLFNNVLKGSPAGGAFSTAEDMYKFAIALRLHRLLDPQYTNLVLSTKISKPNSNERYTIKKITVYGVEYLVTFSSHGPAGVWNDFGFAVWSSPSLVGHTGGNPGIDDFFGIEPNDKGYIIIILSNQTGPGRIKLLHKIQELLSFPVQSLDL